MRLELISFILVYITMYSQASEEDSTCNTIEANNFTITPCYNQEHQSIQCSSPEFSDGRKCIKLDQHETDPHSPCAQENIPLGNSKFAQFACKAKD